MLINVNLIDGLSFFNEFCAGFTKALQLCFKMDNAYNKITSYLYYILYKQCS